MAAYSYPFWVPRNLQGDETVKAQWWQDSEPRGCWDPLLLCLCTVGWQASRLSPLSLGFLI